MGTAGYPSCRTVAFTCGRASECEPARQVECVVRRGTLDDHVLYLVFVLIDLLIVVGYFVWQGFATASKTLHLRDYVVPVSEAEVLRVTLAVSATRSGPGVRGKLELRARRTTSWVEVGLRGWVRCPRRRTAVGGGLTFDSVNWAGCSRKDSTAESQESEKPTDHAHAIRQYYSAGCELQ